MGGAFALASGFLGRVGDAMDTQPWWYDCDGWVREVVMVGIMCTIEMRLTGKSNTSIDFTHGVLI